MTERTRLGVVLFIVSEANFFLLLICAYVFYHRSGGQGPAAASSLDVFKTGLFSLALFSSSATVWRAGVHLKRGRRAEVRRWLLATIVLGAVFLAGQAREYAHLLREHVTISRDLFGTTFFTLTGFHSFHVLIGLVMLSILFGVTLSGSDREPTAPALDGVSLYWHFVDVVWVFIFAIVYLWKFV
jgi:heme/copper-type cytochrome/quinol oxidase subunit 3